MTKKYAHSLCLKQLQSSFYVKILRQGKQWLPTELVTIKIISPLLCALGLRLSFCVSVWSVCVSANELPAIYLVYSIMMKDRFCYHIDFNICIEWISLKTLYLKVLASFADHFQQTYNNASWLLTSYLCAAKLHAYTHMCMAL